MALLRGKDYKQSNQREVSGQEVLIFFLLLLVPFVVGFVNYNILTDHDFWNTVWHIILSIPVIVVLFFIEVLMFDFIKTKGKEREKEIETYFIFLIVIMSFISPVVYYYYYHDLWYALLVLFLSPLVGGILMGIRQSFIEKKQIKEDTQQIQQEKILISSSNSIEKSHHKIANKFSLLLGTSTGKLAERNHNTSIAPNQEIELNLADACQNVLVLGGIGSGKTTRVIQPILKQLLQQDCGGLIFDIKSDFKIAVEQISSSVGKRNIKTIGINEVDSYGISLSKHNKNLGVNLLKNLPPEMSATFLKSAFFLNGGTTSDSFWVDTATELCKNALGILSYIPESYSLLGLYDYIFNENKRAEFTMTAKENIILMSRENVIASERAERIYNSYASYYDNIFVNFDVKVKQGVLASVSQLLSPFQHPDLTDVFCVESENNADLESILDGDIFLVDLPLSRWGIGGKVVYTFIKLRYFNILQSRASNKNLNQDRPVFFMCDEYQEIISASKVGLSDLNFWDKSRSAKCVGIISSQSISSFKAVIGDETLSDTILQNFRQKICFRTEDERTISYLNRLCGKVEVERISTSNNDSTSKNKDDGLLYKKTLGNSYSTSTNESKAMVERETVDAQLIRSLEMNYAVSLLNIDGQAYDDVVKFEPLFV